MTRYLPYILIVIGFLIGGGAYIQLTGHGKNTVSLHNAESDSAPTPTAEGVDFKNDGPAPEFAGITKWLNTSPLTLQALKGKVVLIDFWTYTCINCIRTLPHVTAWYDTYKDKGLVIIGVHTPEFAFEKVTANVETAIEHYGIHYPVAQDNNYGTWNAYNNQYWPAEYLIDTDGNIVFTHFGEGNYDLTEKAIRTLLGLDANTTATSANTDAAVDVKSPEMYFGTDRLANLDGTQNPSTTAKKYTLPAQLAPNTFALEGTWKFDGEKATLTQGTGKIKLNFYAGKLHMVASGNKKILVEVHIDGKLTQTVSIEGSQLYTLFDSTDYKPHTLELYIPEPEFNAFTFTFG